MATRRKQPSWKSDIVTLIPTAGRCILEQIGCCVSSADRKRLAPLSTLIRGAPHAEERVYQARHGETKEPRVRVELEAS